nr:hypothetical protein [uncultured Albidiferax sp.]
MKAIAAVVGYAYILATVLAMVDLIDMHVCVGKPGACAPAVTAPVKATAI